MKLLEIFSDKSNKFKSNSVRKGDGEMRLQLRQTNTKREFMGAGVESVVYKRTGAAHTNEVVKIVRNPLRDGMPDSIRWLIHQAETNNPFLPKIYKISKIPGDMYKVYSEQLTPLIELTDTQVESCLRIALNGNEEVMNKLAADSKKRLRQLGMVLQVINTYANAGEGPFEEFTEIYESFNSKLKRAIDDLHKYRNKTTAILDLHSKNYMARITPTGVFLVINDPII